MPPLIRVEEGDIATFQGDAVVNAANNHLRMQAGVSSALLEKGGHEIQQECDALIRREGPLDVGGAVVTGAGHLQVRYIIHAAAMGDESPSPHSIRTAIRNSIHLAGERGVRSLAMPILGTGVGGFPFEEAARLILEEVRSISDDELAPDTVVLYGYTAEQAQQLRRLLV